jgi:hypothetical protein
MQQDTTQGTLAMMLDGSVVTLSSNTTTQPDLEAMVTRSGNEPPKW